MSDIIKSSAFLIDFLLQYYVWGTALGCLIDLIFFCNGLDLIDFNGSMLWICGAARAGALWMFYLEPELEPECFLWAGATKNFHCSASLTTTIGHSIDCNPVLYFWYWNSWWCNDWLDASVCLQIAQPFGLHGLVGNNEHIPMVQLKWEGSKTVMLYFT